MIVELVRRLCWSARSLLEVLLGGEAGFAAGDPFDEKGSSEFDALLFFAMFCTALIVAVMLAAGRQG